MAKSYLRGQISWPCWSRLLLVALYLPPNNVFQAVYRPRVRNYYAAFLARAYGKERMDTITALLDPLFDYLIEYQDSQKRKGRIVKFLIAARDSTDPYYPSIDFNRSDIERLYMIYPRSREVIENLDYTEYIKERPPENQ